MAEVVSNSMPNKMGDEIAYPFPTYALMKFGMDK